MEKEPFSKEKMEDDAELIMMSNIIGDMFIEKRRPRLKRS